jgi:hypothetical protein
VVGDQERAVRPDRCGRPEVEALYGGFAGESFTDDSHEYVFVVRRPS